MSILKGFTITIALVLCACKKPTEQESPVASPESTPVVSHQLPTATELFDLQSKCSEMGQKILENNIIGSALTQDQVSHYNPTDNRCYVKLSVTTADLTTPRENFIDDEYLFDGQSKEMLATISTKGGKGGAQVFDSSLMKMVKDPSVPTTDEVSDLMNKFVSTERRP